MKHIPFLSFALSSIMLFGCTAPSVEPDPEPIVTPDPKPEEPKPEEPKPEEPKPEPVRIGLAQIHITSPQPIEHKSTWVEGASAFMVSEYGDTTQLGTLKIKLRGNSTRWYVKKSYNFKLETKAEILGMDDNKSWCLLAQWMDRTLLRNDVAFQIAKRTKGLSWTPGGDFVEMYLNGEHQGNYYLCEKIKIGKHRVNISEQGGYILELDSYFDEDYKFYSQYKSLPVMVKEPDPEDMTDELFKRIKNEFNSAEAALRKISSGDKSFLDLVDIDSFIDFYFVQELSMNAEPNHPKSCYMYHDATGKFFAGPAWDFDWYTFVPDYSLGWINYNNLWYGYLFQSPEFKARMKEKWEEEKGGFATIKQYIEERAEYIRESALVNCQMWPIDQYVNGDERKTWDQAVSRMKDAYSVRYARVDKLISEL